MRIHGLADGTGYQLQLSQDQDFDAEDAAGLADGTYQCANFYSQGDATYDLGTFDVAQGKGNIKPADVPAADLEFANLADRLATVVDVAGELQGCCVLELQ